MDKKGILILFTCLLLATGCNLATKPSDPMYQTLTPLTASVIGTATARALNSGGSGDQLATAFDVATQKSSEIYATQTARASLSDASKLATATAIAPVVAELPRYGIDPGLGHVAWLQGPLTIDLNGYQQNGYANDFSQVTAKDFVMAADITWFTQYGFSGCGFMFRSNGDKNQPNQYNIFLTRFADGTMVFAATAKGDIANLRVYFPSGEDKSFQWLNNTTNRLAVVARGNLIDLYTNGVKIGEVDTTQPPPPLLTIPDKPVLPAGANSTVQQDYQDQLTQFTQVTDQINATLAQAQANFLNKKSVYTDGILGFLGMSDSGRTTCKFSNAWLFIIDR
ncbi:MAG: hypothetical protein ABSB41_02630 [Anaerolineales bacterium]|jgi:hypothetical protein